MSVIGINENGYTCRPDRLAGITVLVYAKYASRVNDGNNLGRQDTRFGLRFGNINLADGAETERILSGIRERVPSLMLYKRANVENALDQRLLLKVPEDVKAPRLRFVVSGLHTKSQIFRALPSLRSSQSEKCEWQGGTRMLIIIFPPFILSLI